MLSDPALRPEVHNCGRKRAGSQYNILSQDADAEVIVQFRVKLFRGSPAGQGRPEMEHSKGHRQT